MKYAYVSALALVALAGCSSKNIDTIDAVKQGVIRDMGKNINVGAMDVNVVSVSFRDKEADAVVSFAPKGGPPAMSMNYTMERKGDEWHIKARAQSDLQKHAAQAPPGTAPAGGDAGAMGGAMPAGHGAMVGGGSGDSKGSKLPEGHPPLDK